MIERGKSTLINVIVTSLGGREKSQFLASDYVCWPREARDSERDEIEI